MTRLLDVAIVEGVFIASQLVTGVVRERRVLALERDLEQKEGFAPNSWDMRCIVCGKRMRTSSRGVYSESFVVGEKTVTRYMPYHLRRRNCAATAMAWWTGIEEISRSEAP